MNLRIIERATSALSRLQPVRRRVPPAGLALFSLFLSSCGEDSPLAIVETEIPVSAAVSDSNLSVGDLRVSPASETTLLVTWTQVADEVGDPASYRVKYTTSPLTDWKDATIGCDRTLVGTRVGAPLSCVIEGLQTGTTYDVQLMSYRVVNGTWRGPLYSNVAAGTPASAVAAAGTTVQDLSVAGATETSLTVRWTQVDDGTGAPARYRVKHAPPSIDWKTATKGCDVVGDRIGAEASCTIEGLGAGTRHEFQLMSYRVVGGAWLDAQYSNVAAGETGTTTTSLTSTTTVQDLAVAGTTDAALSLTWTQVDDGTGQPARYRVKYGASPLTDWKTAINGCDVVGDRIGATASCVVDGLAPGTRYDVQLMSYRLASGAWQNAKYSNVGTGETAGGPDSGSGGGGIWISPAEIAALPTSGAAWNNVKSEADGSCGSVDLADQEQTNNVCIMAKALVYARIGGSSYRDDVVGAIRQVVSSGTYNGRALALGRELAAYVIAADLIGLSRIDSSLDGAFRAKLRELLTTYTHSGPSSLVECHEIRPNNWGTHCGGSRAAVAAYLGDTAELDRVAAVFAGWLGNRSAYAGFKYGDTSWQCDASRPVGINPAGCTRDGHSLDGVIADDQRRGGSYTWPAPRENYVWEALQGALVQAVILERAGYPAFQWENRALERAARWLHEQVSYPAEGDDQWQAHLLNRFYGNAFPESTPARAGKNVGWTDWTHGG